MIRLSFVLNISGEIQPNHAKGKYNNLIILLGIWLLYTAIMW
jgi:hypothetical protein